MTIRSRLRTAHGRRTLMLASALILLALSGCSAVRTMAVIADSPARQAASSTEKAPALPPAGSGRGGYYQDDGPGAAPPAGLMTTPNAEPRVEPYSKRGNRPYVVFGKTYTPITQDAPFKQRGMGSWYGRKFHGQRTSSGEIYDMYKMTAAHPTLPIPSYARVTNVANGAQVIVRVNDRGPFLWNRIIDLSYTAALKLGYIGKGSTELEVERLLPAEIARIAAARDNQAGSPAVFAMSSPAPANEIASIIGVTERGDIAGASPAGSSTSLPLVTMAAVSPAGSGFYLQLGAYSQATNAEAARARLAQKWDVALPMLQVVQSGAVYRLHGGPFASRADAAAAAQQVEDMGAGKPVIVQR